MVLSVAAVYAGDATTNPYDGGCVITGPYTPDNVCQVKLGETSNNCMTDCKNTFAVGTVTYIPLLPTAVVIQIRPINPGWPLPPPPPGAGVGGGPWGGGIGGGGAGDGNPPPPPPGSGGGAGGGGGGTLPLPGGPITRSAVCGNGGLPETWAGEQCERPGDPCEFEYFDGNGQRQTGIGTCDPTCYCPVVIRISDLGGDPNTIGSDNTPISTIKLSDKGGDTYIINVWSMHSFDGGYGACSVEYPNGDHVFKDCYWDVAESSVVVEDLVLPNELHTIVLGIGGFVGTDGMSLENTYMGSDKHEYTFDAGLNAWHPFTVLHTGGQTHVGDVNVDVNVPSGQRMFVEIAQDATTTPAPNDGRYKFMVRDPDGIRHDCMTFREIPVDGNSHVRDLFCDGIEVGDFIQFYIEGQDTVSAGGNIVFGVGYDSLVLHAPDLAPTIQAGGQYTWEGLAYQDATATGPSTFFHVTDHNCVGCTVTRNLYVNDELRAATSDMIGGIGFYKYNYEEDVIIEAGDVVKETMSIDGAPGQWVELLPFAYLWTNEFNKINLPATTLTPGIPQEYGPYSNCESGSYAIGDVRYGVLAELKGATCTGDLGSEPPGEDCIGTLTVALTNPYTGDIDEVTCQYEVPVGATTDTPCHIVGIEVNYNLLSDQITITSNLISGESLSYDETVVFATTCRPFTPPEFAEVSCGDTITGNVVLSQDITGCTGDGLIVKGSLDCNGYTISAAPGNTGTGVVVNCGDDDGTCERSSGGHSVTKCSVEGFKTGVVIGNTDSAILSDFSIVGGTALNEGYVVWDSNAVIQGGTINGVDICIDAMGDGVVDIDDITCLIDSTAGIRLDGTTGGTISNSALTSLSGYGDGIQLLGTTNIVLSGNTLTNFIHGLLINAVSTGTTIGPNEKYFNNQLDASYYAANVNLVQPVYAVNVDTNGDGIADAGHGWLNPWDASVRLIVHGKRIQRVTKTVSTFLKDNVKAKAILFDSTCAQSALALPREMRAQALWACPDVGQVGGLTDEYGEVTIGVPSGVPLIFAGWDQDDTNIYYWTFKGITLATGETAKQGFHKMEIEGSYYAYAMEETVITGAAGETLIMQNPDYVDWVFSEGNEMYYPFIFTSDSGWTVNVCAEVPEGYIIVEPDTCVTTFVGGETKAILFKVLETGSPKPNMKATIKVKSGKGHTKTIKKGIAGKQKAKGKGKGKGVTGAAIFGDGLTGGQLGVAMMLFLVGAVAIFYVYNKKKK
ncbi:MAG: hypothetical protein KAT77_00890 [Nanoarchaeota archaeon]|nr:hypothetical protein [Nanoarchaeota archaeon]